VEPSGPVILSVKPFLLAAMEIPLRIETS